MCPHTGQRTNQTGRRGQDHKGEDQRGRRGMAEQSALLEE